VVRVKNPAFFGYEQLSSGADALKIDFLAGLRPIYGLH
jgi:hypothetical protein